MRIPALFLLALFAVASIARAVPFDFENPGYTVTMGYDVSGYTLVYDLGNGFSELWASAAGTATAGDAFDPIYDGALCIVFSVPEPTDIVDGHFIIWDILIGPVGIGGAMFGSSDPRGAFVAAVSEDSENRFAFTGYGQNYVGSNIYQYQWSGRFDYVAERTESPGPSTSRVRALEPNMAFLLLVAGAFLMWLAKTIVRG